MWVRCNVYDMAYLFGQICGLTKAHVPHRANVEQAVADLQYSKGGRCYAYIHPFGLKLADPKIIDDACNNKSSCCSLAIRRNHQTFTVTAHSRLD
jgi:hypothetical protein